VSTQLRKASASRNAVTPKVMTMAVSTMACGRGSAVPAPAGPAVRPTNGTAPEGPPAASSSRFAPWLSRPSPSTTRVSVRCSSR
jgi:hypothetical protein